MDTYIRKINTEKKDINIGTHKHKMGAKRIRSTSGERIIELFFAGNLISFDSELLGDEYEMIARDFLELADKVVSDPCLIPKE